MEAVRVRARTLLKMLAPNLPAAVPPGKLTLRLSVAHGKRVT